MEPDTPRPQQINQHRPKTVKAIEDVILRENEIFYSELIKNFVEVFRGKSEAEREKCSISNSFAFNLSRQALEIDGEIFSLSEGNPGELADGSCDNKEHQEAEFVQSFILPETRKTLPGLFSNFICPPVFGDGKEFFISQSGLTSSDDTRKQFFSLEISGMPDRSQLNLHRNGDERRGCMPLSFAL